MFSLKKDDTMQFLRGLGGFTSVVSILAISWWINSVLYRYDWGPQPLAKTGVFALLVWMAVGVSRACVRQPEIGDGVWRICRMAAAGLILIASIVQIAPGYTEKFQKCPTNDIGMTTLDCTAMVWNGGGNPYGSDNINPRPETPKGYRGFHYGPGMFLFYAGAAWGVDGYRACLLLWFSLLIPAGLWLAVVRENTLIGKIEAGLFFFAVLSGSRFMWREYFEVGVNDAGPLALLLIAILLGSRKIWIAAGFLAGLSFSAKFAPAIFLFLALVRRGVPLKFWVACLVGMAPLAWALIDEPGAAFRNIFLSRFYIGISPTGLAYILPEDIRLALSLVAVFGIAMVILRGWGRGVDVREILTSFTLITCFGLLAHREFHANHITWVIVSGAILLAYGRVSLWRWLGGASMVDGVQKHAVSSPKRSKDTQIEQNSN